mgnify:CR=1 FL=1
MTLPPVVLQYLTLGWYIIPIFEVKNGRCACGNEGCRDIGKHPRAGLGLKHATKDTKTAERWAKQWPGCSWAVACRRSGFVAVDVDPRAGGNETFQNLTGALGELPETPTQRSGGDGRHYLLRVPKGTKLRGKLGPGVDLKANGYILVEPSNHISGGFYSWLLSPDKTPIQDMPQRWLEAARKPEPKVHTAKVLQFRPDSEDEIEDALSHIPADDREVWYQVGMAVQAAGGAFELWDKWGQGSEKYDSSDSRKVWNSFTPGGGIGPATLYHYAKQNGWEKKRTTRTRQSQPPPRTDDDAPPDIKQSEPSETWRHGLVWKTADRVTRDPGNAALIITNDEQWEDCLRYNEFTCQPEWAADPPLVAGYPRPEGALKDHDIGYVQHWLLLNYGGSFSVEAVANSVKTASHAHAYHPVADYLSNLKWDGQSRVHMWPTIYFDAPDTEIVGLMGKWWLISAVARIFKPGCKADHVLIFEGPQGGGKSTCFDILGGDWYKDGLEDIRTKDAKIGVQGSWIIEIAELDSIRGQRATTVKQFISKREDKFRPPWGRSDVVFPRQCVFSGSTNEDTYLQDSSGGRRFWPVPVKRLDRKSLRRDRDQLWAEAVHLFKAGVKWWPERDVEISALTTTQDSRYEGDPWEVQIGEYAEKCRMTSCQPTIEGAFTHLDVDVDRRDRAGSTRIGKIFASMDYKADRRTESGIRTTYYVKKHGV